MPVKRSRAGEAKGKNAAGTGTRTGARQGVCAVCGQVGHLGAAPPAVDDGRAPHPPRRGGEKEEEDHLGIPRGPEDHPGEAIALAPGGTCCSCPRRAASADSASTSNLRLVRVRRDLEKETAMLAEWGKIIQVSECAGGTLGYLDITVRTKNVNCSSFSKGQGEKDPW